MAIKAELVDPISRVSTTLQVTSVVEAKGIYNVNYVRGTNSFAMEIPAESLRSLIAELSNSIDHILILMTLGIYSKDDPTLANINDALTGIAGKRVVMDTSAPLGAITYL